MDLKTEWASLDKDKKRSLIDHFINNPKSDDNPDFMSLVKAPEGFGVFASIGPNFQYAVFGRDSLVVADDLLSTHPGLVREIILILARLQGHSVNSNSEEESGRIHHEYRAKKYDDVQIPDYSLGILSRLQQLWGSQGSDVMLYYGGFDGTPLYVRLVCRYIELHGDSILNEEYKGTDNKTHNIRDSIKCAMGWITYKLEESSLGLLEYKRINPHGIENQAWKDSRTSYLHRDGSMPNFSKGVASIEIQGYTYDALWAASKIAADSEEQAKYWQKLAVTISERVIDWFWMEDVEYFAQALDFDDQDKRHQVDTITSNPGLLLQSNLLKDLPEEKRDKYVNAITNMLASADFMTEAGIRSRALRHKDIPGFVDYHGSYTVWHKETNEIAKGLRYIGKTELATNLEARITGAVSKAGEFSEFLYVDGDGKVWYDETEALDYFNKRSPGGNLPIPEPGQAWTISSVYRIVLT
jgi:glycogen debranching enzyme